MIKRILKLTGIIIISIFLIVCLYIIIGGIYSERVLEKVPYMQNPWGDLTEINGVKIHYIKEGEGPPIVMVHGFLGSSDNYKKVIPLLGEHFTVYAIDLIGFGHSDKSMDLNYSRDAMGSVIADFIEYYALENVTLLGHSMGGEVSIVTALNYPHLVDNLVLVNSAGLFAGYRRTPGTKFLENIYLFFIDNIFLSYPSTYLAGTNIFYDKDTLSKVRTYEYYASSRLVPSETLLRLAENQSSGLTMKAIESITQPTLIIWGEYDNIIPVENAYIFHKAIENSQIQIIKQTGHLPFEEKPEEFSRIIVEHLKK